MMNTTKKEMTLEEVRAYHEACKPVELKEHYENNKEAAREYFQNKRFIESEKRATMRKTAWTRSKALSAFEILNTLTFENITIKPYRDGLVYKIGNEKVLECWKRHENIRVCVSYDYVSCMTTKAIEKLDDRKDGWKNFVYDKDTIKEAITSFFEKVSA